MVHRIQTLAALVLTAWGVVVFMPRAEAQRGGKGPPPANVVLQPVEMGTLAPQADAKGNIFFKELADLATEVSAKVTSVEFEEGQHLERGQVMVRLDSSVLEKDLEATRATLEQRKTELRDAEVRFERAKDLLEDDVTTPQEYDNLRFAMEGIRHTVEQTQAEVERLQIMIDKHTIRAPFKAVVLDRNTEVGEWKSTGDTVASIALEGVYDVIANISAEYLPYITPGETLPVRFKEGNINLEGEVVTIIQRGDAQTQSFPLKLRVPYDGPLYEGMGVIVGVPQTAAVECLMVPRDAILFKNGAFYAYTAPDSIARQHRVTVLGYDGLKAGIESDTLDEESLVIVKGHERLRSGDSVVIVDDVLSKHMEAGGD